jgi:hypothetical protein
MWKPSAWAFFILSWTAIVSLLLIYNQQTTSHPMEFGYHAANGALHNLGFGVRGFRDFDEAGHPADRVHFFGPREAVAHVAESLVEFLSGISAAIFILFAMPPPQSGTVRAILPLALLVGCYSLYFYAEARFYTEVVPILCLSASVFFRRDSSSDRTYATSVVICGLLTGILQIAVLLSDDRAAFRSRFAPYEEIVSRKSAQKQIFAISSSEASGDLYPALFYFNTGGWLSNKIVLRGKPADAEDLKRRVPGYEIHFIGRTDRPID